MQSEEPEFKTEADLKHEREQKERDKKAKKYILILNACLVIYIAAVCIYEFWWKKA